MFLLRKRKMILNFGKMLDIMPKFDIITVAFQRQQVAQAVSPAEDGKSILIALPRPCVFWHRDGFPFLNAPTILMEVKSKNAQRKSSV